ARGGGIDRPSQCPRARDYALGSRRDRTLSRDGQPRSTSFPRFPSLASCLTPHAQMTRIPDALHWLAVTAWVGALWTVGLMVAPTLFQHLPDRALAGSIAARLFDYTSLLGIGCGVYLVVFRLAR